MRDGWYRTGDAGFRDAEGLLYIVDRVKDMIITGGENVYSAEVEQALAKHPAVKQCAVIGLPDAKWGERVTAVIIPCSGVRKRQPPKIIAHCRTLIAGYKVPKEVRFVDALPMTATGKVLKRAVRDQQVLNFHVTTRVEDDNYRVCKEEWSAMAPLILLVGMLAGVGLLIGLLGGIELIPGHIVTVLDLPGNTERLGAHPHRRHDERHAHHAGRARCCPALGFAEKRRAKPHVLDAGGHGLGQHRVLLGRAVRPQSRLELRRQQVGGVQSGFDYRPGAGAAVRGDFTDRGIHAGEAGICVRQIVIGRRIESPLGLDLSPANVH